MLLKLNTKVVLILAFCLAIAVPVNGIEIEPESGSLMLDNTTFERAINENKYLLVNFHALWCRYSKKLKPEWNALSVVLKKEGSPVKLAKVEAYDEKEIREKHQIEGYPTIKLFIDGKSHPYNGERNASALRYFLDRKLKNPSLQTLHTVAQVEEKLKKYEWVLLIVESNQAMLDAAFDLGDVYFATVDEKNHGIIGKYGAFSTKQTVSLVSNLTGKPVIFDTQGMTAQDLKKRIAEVKFPEVAKFGAGTAEAIFLEEKGAMVLIKKDDAKGNEALTYFNQAAASLHKSFFFSVANYEDEISRLLADNIGVQESELPAVRIIQAERERIIKYALTEKITKESIEQFYNDYTENKATRAYVSEPVPEENKDLVRKIVTKNFEEVVLDTNKDALVLFWVPWCGHCRAMMPIYDNVARKVREVENFVIGKIDVSVNDIEKFGLDITEYPTILLFTANNKKEPFVFSGERNEYVFDAFIHEHATVPLGKMKKPNPFDKNEL